MIVDLDRKDIESLIKGTIPSYYIMNKIPTDLGSYVGGFSDGWRWNCFFPAKYTDKELFEIYLMCKK